MSSAVAMELGEYNVALAFLSLTTDLSGGPGSLEYW